MGSCRMTFASSCSIVWFRDDLRLDDQPALGAAIAAGRPLLALFILDERATLRPLGAAARWWLHGSLAALGNRLEALGVPLILRRGDTIKILSETALASGATVLYHGRQWDSQAMALEGHVEQAMAGLGVTVMRFNGGLLHAPEALQTGSGQPYRVFTPFWRAALSKGAPRPAMKAPRTPLPAVTSLNGERLEQWRLRPASPDWAGAFHEGGTPGEDGARQRLYDFLAHDLAHYADRRDRPDFDVTSKLSASLRFGDLSPYRLWHAAEAARESGQATARHVEKFHAELGWREFCHHLLGQWPDLHRRNFQPAFDRFPWRDDERGFKAWRRGLTGFPIVDAGMRQLWRTGLMHNRVRMIAASFLVKHLLIDWRRGEEWFWDTLLDACPANNPANWQWVAGTGADAAPYFRIFNPVLQGEKFDPEGDYIRRFVPELNRLPARFMHRPWEAGGLLLEEAGIRLGKTYPYPIIDLGEGRARALSALASLKD